MIENRLIGLVVFVYWHTLYKRCQFQLLEDLHTDNLQKRVLSILRNLIWVRFYLPDKSSFSIVRLMIIELFPIPITLERFRHLDFE